MREPPKNRRAVLAGLTILACVTLAGCPPNIPPGTDCWTTQPGTQQGLAIPANFFGPASDPVNAVVALEGEPLDPGFVSEVCDCPGEEVQVELVWVDRHGNPTDPTSVHAVKQSPVLSTDVDTCIYRSVMVDWNGEGVAIKAEIQLRGLSLKSVQPLEVTYHATTDPTPSDTKRFNVFITQSAVQPKGEMTFTPDDLKYSLAEGKINLGELPVRYDVRFEEVSPGTVVRELKSQPLSFVGTPGEFIRRR